MPLISRRRFLGTAAVAGAIPWIGSTPDMSFASEHAASRMRFGLVTYLWGKDMDLPTVIRSCEQSGFLGVELRTEHSHGVEPSLSKAEREEVRKRFADSPVTLVGYGSNAQFHEDDPAKVRANIELTKAYVDLMHDCGGSGVKVKPNGLVKGVPQEKTVEQIGRALNQVAKYGADFGQQIRVEAHGHETNRLPVMKAIFDVADHPNATICWNSNTVDVEDGGLRQNFDLVKDRFGATVHVHELDQNKYPYDELFRLFLKMDYEGWILLEAWAKPTDPVAAMTEQRKLFEQLVAKK